MAARFITHNSTADVWRHRPALAIHIAHISQVGSLVEIHLASIFTYLTGSNRQAIGAMFLSVVSLPTRLTMLRTLSADKLSDADKKELVRLCEQVNKFSKKRVSVIHGLWAIRDDRPASIFMIKNFFASQQRAQEYDESRFKQIETELLSLLIAVRKFDNRLWGVVAEQ